MKIKKDVDIFSDEFWYDLIYGGYLSPEKILEGEEDILRVKQAISVLSEYEQLLIDNNILEG